MSIEAKQATPHNTLIGELMDSRIPKTDREHAAAREIERLRQAIEQAEKQEPVAWMYVNKDGECEQIEYGHVFDDHGVTLLYTAPVDGVNMKQERVDETAKGEHEPVAWRWKERINGDFDSWVVTSSEPPPYATEKQPLYTAPPRHPLTDEEIVSVANTVDGFGVIKQRDMNFARAIEAAHGIKENT